MISSKQPSITMMPLWKQDGDNWRLHVGDKVVGSLLAAGRECGLPVYIMLVHTDWPEQTAPHSYNVSEWYALEDAKDFMRRWWITKGSRAVS